MTIEMLGAPPEFKIEYYKAIELYFEKKESIAEQVSNN
jgi:hypothetical protein